MPKNDSNGDGRIARAELPSDSPFLEEFGAIENYSSVASSVIYNGVLYLVKTGGIIVSMDPVTGQVFKVGRATGKGTVIKAAPQWEILAINDLGEECHATPAIAGGSIFVRTRTELHCYRLRMR